MPNAMLDVACPPLKRQTTIVKNGDTNDHVPAFQLSVLRRFWFYNVPVSCQLSVDGGLAKVWFERS